MSTDNKKNLIQVFFTNFGEFITRLFCSAIVFSYTTSAALSEPTDTSAIYHSAVQAAEKCKTVLRDKQDIIIIGNTICAYGTITEEFSKNFSSMKIDNGMYIVFRSGGGYLLPSIEVGKHVLNKNITLVVSDFCLSGCANYAFLAAERKVVLPNSFVAWHGGAPDPALAELDVLDLRIKEREAEDEFFKQININPELVRDIPKDTSITEENKKSRLWSHSPEILRKKWKIKGIVYMWFPAPEKSDKVPE